MSAKFSKDIVPLSDQGRKVGKGDWRRQKGEG
jgi:hypothetical protein